MRSGPLMMSPGCLLLHPIRMPSVVAKARQILCAAGVDDGSTVAAPLRGGGWNGRAGRQLPKRGCERFRTRLSIRGV